MVQRRLGIREYRGQVFEISANFNDQVITRSLASERGDFDPVELVAVSMFQFS